MEAEIEVIQAGLLSTIQDNGRYGFMKFGVPISGVMDTYAATMCNLILGNSPSAAILEITQMGPKLKFSKPSVIAICGGYLEPKLNGVNIENCKPYDINSEDIVSFGRRKKGCRAYLSILGGFQTSEILGSKSWYKGLTQNSKLEKGIKLFYNSNSTKFGNINAALKFSSEYIHSNEVEVYPGPEYHLLNTQEKQNIMNTEYEISEKNNRMAFQLKETMCNSLKPIITGPVMPGTVQLTSGGRLLVLMKDCQTTGGYPRILQLNEYGMNTIAQKVAREKIRFKMLDYRLP
ncbi:biotin-dependent carboxyltransferase family protein [Gillisia sp. M10.2A]|uniref:Biotin-dependent carboxyltransferase family protein n=1 Tax=Gillisia lutea TaxID=2909668 RepID=A0ABS9EI88_9FLAO|nr:biotin-dependent carboxyltransferase family protein [Gillisia lutea]MCF4102578.1 biotin-dependent carboxyltransferase family protein [Gillisia lutea]